MINFTTLKLSCIKSIIFFRTFKILTFTVMIFGELEDIYYYYEHKTLRNVRNKLFSVYCKIL